MKKLLSAIEYLEHITDEFESMYDWEILISYSSYIDFLKQPLQLWMFIPCDKEGKPMSEPIKKDMTYYQKLKEYQQACDRKIFTGFELYQDTYFNNYNCIIRSSDMVIINIENKTIEDIAPLKVEVTDRISKQFKLK